LAQSPPTGRKREPALRTGQQRRKKKAHDRKKEEGYSVQEKKGGSYVCRSSRRSRGGGEKEVPGFTNRNNGIGGTGETEKEGSTESLQGEKRDFRGEGGGREDHRREMALRGGGEGRTLKLAGEKRELFQDAIILVPSMFKEGRGIETGRTDRKGDGEGKFRGREMIGKSSGGEILHR